MDIKSAKQAIERDTWQSLAANKNLHSKVWHYFEIKLLHPDRLLVYRVGDFFEAFSGDASLLAQALELVITRQLTGNESDRIPMCGFPAYVLVRYSALLSAKSLKVVIVDYAHDQNSMEIPQHLIPRTTTLLG